MYMLCIVKVVCEKMFEKYCNIGWMNLAGMLIGAGENKCIQNFIL